MAVAWTPERDMLDSTVSSTTTPRYTEEREGMREYITIMESWSTSMLRNKTIESKRCLCSGCIFFSLMNGLKCLRGRLD